MTFWSTVLCYFALLCIGIFSEASSRQGGSLQGSLHQCGGHINIVSYVHVALPSRHNLYTADYNYCEWVVTLQPNVPQKPLQVQIANWTVSEETFASVDIYDGEKRRLASFDQSTSSLNISKMVFATTGPQVRIVFSSDAPLFHLALRATFFDAIVKVEGECVPGTKSCGDGKTCYTDQQTCDGQVHCVTAYDELGCKHCLPTEFWCGSSDASGCYKADERCNGHNECQENGQDESECESCGPGAFLCKTGKKCIFERWLCDGDVDCEDSSDEDGCSYEASRKVVTAAIIGSLICCLLLVISLGCTCKLYSLRASHNRHPHHHYRATPLTRVEREIFARQAPPTYDMTLTGASSENSRHRRDRRRRRYHFERTAPANIGHQSNINNRQESIQSGNTQQDITPSQSTPTPSPPPAQVPSSSGVESSPPPVSAEQHAPSNLLQHFGSFLFESMRSTTQGQSSSPTQSSTPVPAATQGSTTPADAQNRCPGSSLRAPPSRRREQCRTSTSGRSRRSTSGNGPSSSSSKNQQAKPLPKKKRILPVKVSAPLAAAAVEEDMLACVYPCPPSYSQAVASGTQATVPATQVATSETQTVDSVEKTTASEGQAAASDAKNRESMEESLLEDSQSSSRDVESPREDQFSTGVVESPRASLTRPRSFLLSIGRAFRTFAAVSVSRFQRNPYLQMPMQDSRRNSDQSTRTAESSSHAFATDGTRSFIVPARVRHSVSSDEDMLDCGTTNSGSVRRDSADDPLTSVAAVTSTPTAPSGKIFPKRTLTFFRPAKNGVENHDMSDIVSRLNE